MRKECVWLDVHVAEHVDRRKVSGERKERQPVADGQCDQGLVAGVRLKALRIAQVRNGGLGEGLDEGQVAIGQGAPLLGAHRPYP